MTAIITQDMRVRNADNFINTVGTDSVYFFIGRSQPWPNSDTDVATPVDRVADQFGAQQKMVALKRIAQSDVTNAITRYNWISGNTYAEYDDQDSALTTKQFYVITDDLNVYKCLKVGSGASVVKPTGTNVYANPEAADGYIWKYMYTLSGTQASKFLTNTFIPVNTLTVDDGSLQWDVQTASEVGAIHRIRVTAGGTGYTSAPTVTIDGDGAGATATATVVAGVVTEITMSTIGNNYSQAVVTISGGGGSAATARAVISPVGGHGSDPVTELGGFFTMLNVQLDGSEGAGDFPVDNDYRQLGMVLNPYEYGTTNVATATTLIATEQLTYTGLSGGNFAPDDLMVGQTSGAQAYIDSVDTVTGTIRFHQETGSGFGTFQVGESVEVGGVSATVNTLVDPEAEKFSGDVLYIENRSPVTRAADQIEDVKLVLEF